MTVLVDFEIKRMVEEGEIIISPYEPENVNSGSVDIRLGENYFMETMRLSAEEGRLINPWGKRSAERMWGKPLKAVEAYTIFSEYLLNEYELQMHDRIIVLESGKTILGHTLEFIGGRTCVITQMQARSSIGRVCVEICKCAGWGDHGYCNRWTMEITNNAEHHDLILIVGRRVGQIVFIETSVPTHIYSSSGKYQAVDDLDELKAAWKPEMMLPQLWKDRELTTQAVLRP